MLLLPVTRKTPSGSLAYVEVAVERTVSVTAAVFDKPSVKARRADPGILEERAVGRARQRRNGVLHDRVARADVEIVVVSGERHAAQR